MRQLDNCGCGVQSTDEKTVAGVRSFLSAIQQTWTSVNITVT